MSPPVVRLRCRMRGGRCHAGSPLGRRDCSRSGSSLGFVVGLLRPHRRELRTRYAVTVHLGRRDLSVAVPAARAADPRLPRRAALAVPVLHALGARRRAAACRVEAEGAAADAKAAWLSSTLLDWGSCGQVVRVDGAVAGYALYAPPAYLPGLAAYPTAPGLAGRRRARRAAGRAGARRARARTDARAGDGRRPRAPRRARGRGGRVGPTGRRVPTASSRPTSCSPSASPPSVPTRARRACGSTCAPRPSGARTSSRPRWTGCSAAAHRRHAAPRGPDGVIVVRRSATCHGRATGARLQVTGRAALPRRAASAAALVLAAAPVRASATATAVRSAVPAGLAGPPTSTPTTTPSSKPGPTPGQTRPTPGYEEGPRPTGSAAREPAGALDRRLPLRRAAGRQDDGRGVVAVPPGALRRAARRTSRPGVPRPALRPSPSCTSATGLTFVDDGTTTESTRTLKNLYQPKRVRRPLGARRHQLDEADRDEDPRGSVAGVTNVYWWQVGTEPAALVSGMVQLDAPDLVAHRARRRDDARRAA